MSKRNRRASGAPAAPSQALPPAPIPTHEKVTAWSKGWAVAVGAIFLLVCALVGGVLEVVHLFKGPESPSVINLGGQGGNAPGASGGGGAAIGPNAQGGPGGPVQNLHLDGSPGQVPGAGGGAGGAASDKVGKGGAGAAGAVIVRQWLDDPEPNPNGQDKRPLSHASDNAEAKTTQPQPINITSNNQSGGITAQNVNIFGPITPGPRHLTDKMKMELDGIMSQSDAKFLTVDASGGNDSRDFALEIVNYAKSKSYPAEARNYSVMLVPPKQGVTVSGPDQNGAIIIHVGSP